MESRSEAHFISGTYVNQRSSDMAIVVLGKKSCVVYAHVSKGTDFSVWKIDPDGTQTPLPTYPRDGDERKGPGGDGFQFRDWARELPDGESMEFDVFALGTDGYGRHIDSRKAGRVGVKLTKHGNKYDITFKGREPDVLGKNGEPNKPGKETNESIKDCGMNLGDISPNFPW
jgi:hypothetical protein